MYRYYNPNPYGRNVGDCTVRALSKAMDKAWSETYLALCVQGFIDGDMPSANSVWGNYLREQGYRRYIIPDTCPNCYTVADFAQEHPDGAFIVALSGHVVCVKDGAVWDSWDSGDGMPLYYWVKENEHGV